MNADIQAGLLAAYKRLLAPLIRILLRNGVDFLAFQEVAKRVFVDVAEKDFLVAESRPARTEKISALTGIAPEEVASLIVDRGYRTALTSNLNRITRVLTGWHTDTDFTGPYGLPLELPFEGGGEKRDFASLIGRYAPDVPPSFMRDELKRARLIKETEPGWYKVLTRTYVPDASELDSLERLGIAVKNFVETLDFNRQEAEPNQRLFERTVVADNGIRPEDLPRFKVYVRSRAQLLLEEIDNWLSQLDTPSASDGDAVSPVETGVGIFHYVEVPSAHHDDEIKNT